MFWSLVRSDVLVLYSSITLGNIIRAFFNPSIHACFLIRLSNFVESKFLHVLIRNLLIAKHSIDVGYRVEVGRSLKLPHPFGIVIGDGVEIGDNLTLYHNCTFGKKIGYPRIGNSVTIFPNSIIVGDIYIEDHCVVGANSFLDKSLPAHATFFSGVVKPGPEGKAE